MAELTPEQIAANEATVLAEKETAELKKQTKGEALRDLSKELGINAFEPEELKAKFNELKARQDSQLTEQEKLQAQLGEYKTKETEWQSKLLNYESQLEASKLGIHADKLEDALKLAGGDPSKLADVVKKYPTFKTKEAIKIGITDPHNNQQPTDSTEAVAYMKSDPRYRKYLKDHNK